MQTLSLTQPDDWHVHVRDGAALPLVSQHTAKQMARAIIMPNLKPPVTNVAEAEAYRARILAALPENTTFEPLMTLYLTSQTTPADIEAAAKSPFVHAVKLYPAGATTNSDAGVAQIDAALPVFAAMAACGLPLLVHGEVTDPAVDIFDREAVFIERVFLPLIEKVPSLRVVFEHITTRQAAEFVAKADAHIGATITAHHLLMNRNALFVGGIRPHHYCLPVLKREEHRQALLAAATSGNPRFFLGTDSAPHAQSAKETSCGCAGMYTAFAAIELYAEAFEEANALDKLEAFASFHGADFYGLPRNQKRITLRREAWQVPDFYDDFNGERLVPLRAGEMMRWAM